MRAVPIFILFLAVSIPVLARNKAAIKPASDAQKTAFTPVSEYDPARDASRDIAAAVAEAARTHRNVMVEIGGKWCVWCGYMDKFFDQNSTLRDFRDQKYVMVKVNFSPENKNEKALSKYPKVGGYPHIFILGPDGKLLHSQDTSKLEEGRGYSTAAMAKFLQDWAPKS